MIHIVGNTRNGIMVEAELISSSIAASIGRQPHLLTLVSELLPQITLTESEHTIECDMGRSIGYNSIIEMGASENIFYAKLAKEDTYTRFIRYTKPLASSLLTMHFTRKEGEKGYLLQDIWIGHSVPPLPGSAKENDLSKSYWAEHALVYDGQPVQSNTVTKTCPY